MLKHCVKMSFKHKVIEIFVSVNQSLMHMHACAGVNFGIFIMKVFLYICLHSKFQFVSLKDEKLQAFKFSSNEIAAHKHAHELMNFLGISLNVF